MGVDISLATVTTKKHWLRSAIWLFEDRLSPTWALVGALQDPTCIMKYTTRVVLSIPVSMFWYHADKYYKIIKNSIYS